METFKANFLIFIFIVSISYLGFWAFNNIKATNLALEADDTISDVGPVVITNPEPSVAVNNPSANVSKPAPEQTKEENKSNSNQALINDLEKLVADNVLMKKGSQGTRVGVVQEFLNIYGIKMSVDNDYGDTTVNAVKKFQADQKIYVDGQAGVGTYKKMIAWLEKN